MIPSEWEHLPVYNGLPVPWVAMWSGEMDRRRSRLTRWQGCDWITTNNRVGVPDFGSTNSARQRAGMIKRRCQICGERGADTWVCPNDADLTGQHVGLWADGLVLNPPVHEHCLAYSREVCPHLAHTEPHAVVKYGGDAAYVAATTVLRGAMTVINFEQARQLNAVCREVIIRLG